MIQNNSFSKFGSSPTFTDFNENLVSEFVSQACRTKSLWLSTPTWCRLLVEVSIGAWFKNSYIVEKQLHNGM